MPNVCVLPLGRDEPSADELMALQTAIDGELKILPPKTVSTAQEYECLCRKLEEENPGYSLLVIVPEAPWDRAARDGVRPHVVFASGAWGSSVLGRYLGARTRFNGDSRTLFVPEFLRADV